MRAPALTCQGCSGVTASSVSFTMRMPAWRRGIPGRRAAEMGHRWLPNRSELSNKMSEISSSYAVRRRSDWQSVRNPHSSIPDRRGLTSPLMTIVAPLKRGEQYTCCSGSDPASILNRGDFCVTPGRPTCYNRGLPNLPSWGTPCAQLICGRSY